WPQYGPDLLARPDVPRDLPSLAKVFPDAKFPGVNRRVNSAERAPLSYLRPAEGLGGNAFAAGPRRTIGDATVLASDLHSKLTAPGLFYLARLELASGGVIGVTVPGMPVILSGRNPNVAWALTPLGIDDADIVMEEVQPGNPDRYRAPDGWHSFATRREVIRIRDADDQTITLRETRNGPVVPGIDPGLADVTPLGHVPALRWTGLEPQDTSMSALLGLMRAQDMDSSTAALVQMVAPALSVILASDSQIASLVAGTAPQRASDHPTAGAMPAPGWLASTQWSDPMILAQSPDRAESGVALTTDERPSDGLRLARLARLLGDREVHSRDSFIAAQTDIVSPAARALLPLVGADLWFTEEPAAPGTAERRRQDALALLAEWDGAMNEHLPEPLLYAAWLSALQDRLIRDELGPLADDITRLHPAFIDAVFRNRDGMERWCDIIQSAATEDCTTIARQALDRAIQDLTARFGPEVASWRWGDLHQARHQHPGLGSLSGLRWIANITQSVSGGDFTVARSGFFGRAPTPFAADRGAGFRGVFDLADPDSSVFIISTGQSGHPLSRHYDDLSSLWRRGEYIVMSLDPELARAASAGITTLVPAD
ncbi:MAG: penicillin acylase family protein, partial [Paracoccus sp. (in: a-proteobacteria)]|nr:penicillin acylase family protein [Paracoccus sp. (in: a-proteobacteria)]